MADSAEFTELVDSETQKNKKKIRCVRCDSYILQPNTAIFTKLEESLQIPSMKQKKDLVQNNTIETDQIYSFWMVTEMYTFENVGFTNTVDNKKYLICADCEIGPIGIQSIDKPNQFLVCLDRVKHV